MTKIICCFMRAGGGCLGQSILHTITKQLFLTENWDIFNKYLMSHARSDHSCSKQAKKKKWLYIIVSFCCLVRFFWHQTKHMKRLIFHANISFFINYDSNINPFVYSMVSRIWWIFWQIMMTQMKCCIMPHFIRVYTIPWDKNYLQRKK